MYTTTTLTLRGRVGADPRSRRTNSGTFVATFRLAVPKWRYSYDGVQHAGRYIEDGTTWYTVEAWDTLADNVFSSVRKGHPVIVVAKPLANGWTDQDGITHSSLVMRALTVGHDLGRGHTVFHRNGDTGTPNENAAEVDDSTPGNSGAQLSHDDVQVRCDTSMVQEDNEAWMHAPDTPDDSLSEAVTHGETNNVDKGESHAVGISVFDYPQVITRA